jgi:DNA repair protein RadC
LSVIIGSGTRGASVTAISRSVLELCDATGGPPTVAALQAIRGLGTAKASVIAAALEFARRMLCPERRRIGFPAEVIPVIQHYADRKQEHFLCVSLNGAHEVIACRVVSIGLVNRTVVHPREVFADAITDRAAAVLVAHNHPSGNVIPSPDDRDVTARLRSAGNTLGVQVLDHIVFSTTGYYSFLEHGEL